MRLLELHIDGFGKFHDRTISFNDGINIIYGKNEAGKSTLHTFIRGMLFGIERRLPRSGSFTTLILPSADSCGVCGRCIRAVSARSLAIIRS